MESLHSYINEALKKLGSGEEGTIYDLGNDRVRKIFHRGRVPVAYQLLKAATDYGVIRCLPQVYEVGDDYIIRENCTPNTSKCKEYYKISQVKHYSNGDTLYWEVMNGNYWYDPDKDAYYSNILGVIPKKHQEVMQWLCRLKYEISQVCGERAGLGDFGLKNLGETKDGRVVMMDF